jgi:hypothetical protein
MLEHTSYNFSRAIRKHSFKTITNILAVLDYPTNITVFKNLFAHYISLIEKSIEKSDLKELKVILKAFFMNCKTLNEINKAPLTNNYMDTTNFNTLGPLLQKVLELVKVAK